LFFQRDIKKFLDEAPDGVIYFSMESILESSELPEVKRQAFLDAFSKRKQRVLWKWESDTLPGQPKNVIIGKWLPQSDILGNSLISFNLCLLLAPNVK
jgi:glucuronosyltransferase